MTPTFSTMLNFGIMGLLQRLHRIHIQHCLENDSETSEIIKYPCKEAHKDKDGHKRFTLCNVHAILNDKIVEVVKKAKEVAKSTIESLGMYDLLKKNNYEDPPKCNNDDNDDDDNDEDDDEYDYDDDKGDKQIVELDENNCKDLNEMTNDITKLNSTGIIEKGLCDHLSNLQKSKFKCISGMYEVQSSPSTSTKPSTEHTEKKSHSPYVEVQYGQRTVYVNKTTVVWLLQEAERVSADRLFHVRNKQPFSSSSSDKSCPSDNSTNHVAVSETLSVGDICVFKISSTQWKLGRVLNFSYYLEKTKSSQQYTKTSYSFADKSKKAVGVLCSWYVPVEISSKFTLAENCVSHKFISVQLYICTLCSGCFEAIENDNPFPSLITVDGVKSQLAMAKNLVLTSSALTSIQNLFQSSATGSNDNPVIINDRITGSDTVVLDVWSRCGNITLSKKEKLDSICFVKRS